jgi:hypothetical protein
MIKLTLLLLRYLREMIFIPALSHFLPDCLNHYRKLDWESQEETSSNNGTALNMPLIELDLLLLR